MDALKDGLEFALKVAALIGILIWWDRRLTRIEVLVGELIEWKRDLARRS